MIVKFPGRRAKEFRADERGSATVEAVLWLPAFVFLFVMIADVSLVFHRQSQILRVTQDANRAYSVGKLSSNAATEAFIKSALANLSSRVTATTVVTGGIIKSDVRVPVVDLVAVGFFKFLSGYSVSVKAEHFLEY